MSHLYEDKIKNMGNAGRNGGEYYTPRALIRTIVKVLAPQIGQTVYDGAAGITADTQRLEAIYTQKLISLDELKQSLLQKAFAGQLKGTTS